jgi:hypothetical protein
MRWTVAAAAILPFLFPARVGHAHGIPKGPQHDWSLGGSTAYAFYRGAAAGVVYGVDFAYSPNPFVWIGAGIRSFENFSSADRALYPYAEAGAWLFLNIGAGYSLDTADPFSTASGFHLFLGLPVPLIGRF